MLPIVIVASFVLAPFICWAIEPMLGAKWSRQQDERLLRQLEGTRPSALGSNSFRTESPIPKSDNLERNQMSKNSSKPVDVGAPKNLAEAARASPTTVFDAPEKVVKSDALTKKEKGEVLDQWEADAKALQIATDEGMSGGKRPRLDEVKAAQTELDAKESKLAK